MMRSEEEANAQMHCATEIMKDVIINDLCSLYTIHAALTALASLCDLPSTAGNHLLVAGGCEVEGLLSAASILGLHASREANARSFFTSCNESMHISRKHLATCSRGRDPLQYPAVLAEHILITCCLQDHLEGIRL